MQLRRPFRQKASPDGSKALHSRSLHRALPFENVYTLSTSDLRMQTRERRTHHPIRTKPLWRNCFGEFPGDTRAGRGGVRISSLLRREKAFSFSLQGLTIAKDVCEEKLVANRNLVAKGGKKVPEG